jgi:small subunit ribosomal protein S9
MEATMRYYGTGRRKASVARVWLQSGAGKIEVNERPVDDFFPRQTLKMILTQPLKVAGIDGKYDVIATVDGGGISGQAGAIRLGIARALLQLDAAMRSTLPSRTGTSSRAPFAMARKISLGLLIARRRCCSCAGLAG